MSLLEALSGNKEYALRYEEYKVFFTLRRPNSQEDLEYRRRASKVAVKNKAIESSDTALNASLWLFEKLKVKAEYTNGSDVRQPLSAEEYAEVSDQAKLTVINTHLSQLAGEEVEQEKN